jgi:hypothetical protein
VNAIPISPIVHRTAPVLPGSGGATPVVTAITALVLQANPGIDLATLRGAFSVATQEGQRPLSLDQALRAVDLIAQARANPSSYVSVFPQVDEVVTADAPPVSGTDDLVWTDGGLTDISAL